MVHGHADGYWYDRRLLQCEWRSDQRGYLLYMEVIINEQSTDIKSVRRHKSVTKQLNGQIKGHIIIKQ